MAGRRRKATVAATTVTSVVAVAVVSLGAALAWISMMNGTAKASVAAAPAPIAVTATVAVPAAGLRPGASGSGRVSVTNGGPSAVVVTAVGAGASKASGDCPPGVVTTGALADAVGLVPIGSDERSIAPGASAEYDVTAALAADAPSACAGRPFQLDLEVTAVGG